MSSRPLYGQRKYYDRDNHTKESSFNWRYGNRIYFGLVEFYNPIRIILLASGIYFPHMVYVGNCSYSEANNFQNVRNISYLLEIHRIARTDEIGSKFYIRINCNCYDNYDFDTTWYAGCIPKGGARIGLAYFNIAVSDVSSSSLLVVIEYELNMAV